MCQFIETLEQIIKDRKENPVPGSYTTSLFEKGLDRILKKIGEEAGEVIIAAKNNDKEELTNEAADLIYHLIVTLQHQNVSLKDVYSVLEARHKS
jgi:phosphoribosyl-AMP cyclohydrolase / phosphoribosyl-ATP pyrophosphohydrolase